MFEMLMKCFAKTSWIFIFFLLALPLNSFSQSNFFKKYSTASTTCGYVAAASPSDQIRIIGSRFAPESVPFVASISIDGTLENLNEHSTNRGTDNIYALAADSKGSFYAAGTTPDQNRGRDLLIYKIQGNGKILWKWRVGSLESEVITAMALTPTGLILTGTSTLNSKMDILALKVNPLNGKIIWKKAYGDSTPEFGYAIATTKEGGTVIVGVRENIPVVIKIDMAGNIVWSRRIETLSYSQDGLPAITVSGDSYYVVGTTGGGHHLQTQQANDDGIVVTKIGSDGTFIWSRHYFKPNTQLIAWNVSSTSNSEVIITGQMGLDAPKALVFKIDSTGKIKWKKILNQTNSAAFSSVSLSDGSVVSTGCVGTSVLDLFTWKIDGKNGSVNSPCGKLQTPSFSFYSVADRLVSYSPDVRNFSATMSSVGIAKKIISAASRDGCSSP